MYYTLQRIARICQDLERLIQPDRQIVREIAVSHGFCKTPAEADRGSWQTLRPGERWGGSDQFAWFRADIAIPDRFAGQTVLLEVTADPNASFVGTSLRQFLLFVNGQLRQGLDINHKTSLLAHPAVAGTPFRIDLQAYAGLTDVLTELSVQLVTEHAAVKQLYYDVHVPLQVAAELPEDDKTRLDILESLNQVINRLDLRQPYSASFETSVRQAIDDLERDFYQKLCGPSKIKAAAVGHTHIDVAWLWRLSQTRLKTARSFATVLSLMDQYPEYRFMSSQPQLYRFIEQDYPELFEQIRARVREGRWEAEGAMWLEADCNLTSGESLVRQILHGTAYFRSAFGVENKVLWLPDVFGYSAALPQILRLSGIDYFMTTKINWNQYNHIPADTFLWQGIDGSEVLTHFITTTSEHYNPTPHFSTYNGILAPRPVMGGWKRYQDKQIHEEILIAYGFGDGGGGPTEEMLERGRRMARGIPGCPQVGQDHARPFFDRLAATVKDNPWLKKWVGELYFEYHRGTYTSMARNKRDNRRSELLCHDVETLAALAGHLADHPYPAAELHQIWETVLLNQFHDILPGSSIAAVYADSAEHYRQILAQGKALADQALQAIGTAMSPGRPALLVANTAGFARSDLVRLDWDQDRLPDILDPHTGRTLPVQRIGRSVVFVAPDLPAKGLRCYDLLTDGASSGATAAATTLCVSASHLENQFFAIDLNAQGQISRLFDKQAGRDVLAPGCCGNEIRAYEDKPMQHQNWDIDIYYQQKSWPVDDVSALEVVEQGPVQAAVRVSRAFLNSRIVQTIRIYAEIARIDFATEIDWHEDELLLKAAFPVDIHADTATFDIQFGNVTRPTHWNTSWDWARFEVCAQKWADLSEEGYGVSLLNDSKYGHDIRDHVLRLTLLKSGMAPNPQADREQHHFVYALYPHKGSWRQAGTMAQAYSLNLPLYACRVGSLAGSAGPAANRSAFALCQIDEPGHVMLETIKRAEDGDGLILRLFEYTNWRGPVRLTFAGPLQAVSVCDLLERPLAALQPSGSAVSCPFRPYEIKTLRVHLTDGS